MKLHHGALEDEGPARFGLDDLALRGPHELAVAVVAIERGANDRTVKPLVPLTGMALF